MLPNQILGIPIIEEAAPSGFPAQIDRDLHSAIQCAIDMLRCPSCGSLNYETRLYLLTSGVLNMVECRNCGNVRDENFDDNADELLVFLPVAVAEGDASWD